ncbi:short chain dehydrogenase [Pseudomonas sp. M47T1]|nr:short chain dehydrogenase [Pseudomonas sp. M47T1]
MIIGASRGLGLGIVERLTERGWQVTATVRNSMSVELLRQTGATVEILEMNDLAQIEALGLQMRKECFDLILVNAGVLGPVGDLRIAFDEQILGQLFLTNSLAPVVLAKTLAHQLRPGTGVLAFMSSRMGSVANPDGTDMALYKASKAALNSLVNSLVSAWEGPATTFLCLHPGWVKTDLGGDDGDIDVWTSTSGVVDQVMHHAGHGGLHFVDYAGEPVSW